MKVPRGHLSCGVGDGDRVIVTYVEGSGVWRGADVVTPRSCGIDAREVVEEVVLGCDVGEDGFGHWGSVQMFIFFMFIYIIIDEIESMKIII